MVWFTRSQEKCIPKLKLLQYFCFKNVKGVGFVLRSMHNEKYVKREAKMIDTWIEDMRCDDLSLAQIHNYVKSIKV